MGKTPHPTPHTLHPTPTKNFLPQTLVIPNFPAILARDFRCKNL
ncbi:MAG: hypothetical protein PX481_10430 [Microcystis sp. M53603_WE2]|uniref:Uncharacterized protein n=1 Tax=Microcystis aeruginosa NIES-44 TaxID=449439 RepID=A0A0A1VXH6_MICAE|nr:MULTISPECIES: hypothetical protein [unclassified Microcystis]MCZ8361673.1 hypothetical protein [Microcystis sp. LE19-251.1A]MDJ0524238.1 hypothetical protein [Microcystis sp. M53600_WE12]MDJ0543964.1 hypothetical protein [Microcystis sp. M53601_WE4]MDJ0563158.1 hypothetical protein [Microcystis sp. M49629_WE12]ODV37297.1 hypothetical protein BFG60_3197 [Microcystis aeruginosa NIES-98]GAL94502.1 hypothetical protein N44_03082 [Microcystis aeruginosa NIES-44]